jgi:MmyB-like transcription regulator ligand binding domain
LEDLLGDGHRRHRLRPPGVEGQVSDGLLELFLLDSMASTPAFVRNGRLDVLAINPLGRALYVPVFDGPTRPASCPAYSAEPGSPSEDALKLLASWAATAHQFDHRETEEPTLPGANREHST